MATIDAQVHAYERDHPGRPWHGVLAGPDEVTGEQMVAALDANSIDGAILVSAYTMYHYDASYAVAVRNAFPERFALVKPVDPANPAAADVIADWKATPGAVAIRMLLARSGLAEDAADPGLNHVLEEAARQDIPINLHVAGRLAQGRELIRRNPDTRVIIDHIGLVQPHEPPKPDEPWAELPAVLELAQFDNVAIKISGACVLSKQPYPYPDIWDPVCRVIDAFGIDRCIWGTDWTRAVSFLSFREGIEPFRETDRLTEGEKAALMGGTLSSVYGWSPGAT